MLAPGDQAGGWRESLLRRERWAASGLHHDSLADLLDWGEEAGRPYLVYEYLPGGSLARALRRGQMGLPDLVGVLLSVARGLAHLHSRGRVHGDVKPANILFDAGGHPHLIDFGLTVPAGTRVGLAGRTFATPPYAPPEQAWGLPIHPSADVYALCAILYEALTGLRPAPVETVGGRGTDDLPPGVPPELLQVAERGLAAAPSRRPRSGTEIAAALEQYARVQLPTVSVGGPSGPAWTDADTTAGSAACPSRRQQAPPPHPTAER